VRERLHGRIRLHVAPAYAKLSPNVESSRGPAFANVTDSGLRPP
jgi:hypothetical protein